MSGAEPSWRMTRVLPPWMVTASDIDVDLPEVQVFLDQVIGRADGRPGVHCRLVEPEAVRVVAVHGDGELAVVWRWRPALSTAAIELPGASICGDDAGPLDAARRALRTEAGLAAEHWTGLGEIVTATGVAAQTVHLYQARHPHRTLRPPRHSPNSVEAFTLPYDIVLAGAIAGPVHDAASLLALWAAEKRRLHGDWTLERDGGPPPPGPRRPLLRDEPPDLDRYGQRPAGSQTRAGRHEHASPERHRRLPWRRPPR
jgi:8-oxo-dGDP phosphatase